MQPRGIARVLDADGGTAYDNPVATSRVISPQVAYQMVSMLSDVIDRGTGSAARSLGVRFPVGRQDRDDRRFQGCLVRRLLVERRRRRVGRVRSAEDDRPRGVRLALRAADLERLHAPGRASCGSPSEFERPGGLRAEPMCRVSYLRPVEECPTYVEYFKQDDEMPSQLCPLHQGTVKQRVRRAIDGLLSTIGRKLKGIFR